MNCNREKGYFYEPTVLVNVDKTLSKVLLDYINVHQPKKDEDAYLTENFLYDL